MKPERKFALSPRQDEREYAEPEEKQVVESEPRLRLPDWLPEDFEQRSPEEKLKILNAKAESSVEKSAEVQQAVQVYLDETEIEFGFDAPKTVQDEDGRPMVDIDEHILEVRKNREAAQAYRKDERLEQQRREAEYQEQRAFEEQEILFPDMQKGASYREAPVVHRLPSRQELTQELGEEVRRNVDLRIDLMEAEQELTELKQRLAKKDRWAWAKRGILALGMMAGSATVAGLHKDVQDGREQRRGLIANLIEADRDNAQLAHEKHVLRNQRIDDQRERDDLQGQLYAWRHADPERAEAMRAQDVYHRLNEAMRASGSALNAFYTDAFYDHPEEVLLIAGRLNAEQQTWLQRQVRGALAEVADEIAHPEVNGRTSTEAQVFQQKLLRVQEALGSVDDSVPSLARE